MASGNSAPPDASGTQSARAVSIFETTADLLDRRCAQQGLGADALPIIGMVRDLLRALDRGESGAVEDLLRQLSNCPDSDLYASVGKMTRDLHDSLSEFKASLDRGTASMHGTNIPDAADKLEAVIGMTESAAHETLTATEAHLELINASRQRLAAIKAKWETTHNFDERDALFREFLDSHAECLQQAEKFNSTITMAQTFQDLSGQALRKVIRLVTELERNLVSLVRVFGAHAPEQAQRVAQTPSEVATQSGAVAQDDVDSILNKFGF